MINTKHIIVLVSLAVLAVSCSGKVGAIFDDANPSPIYPDYRNVTVPCNIAPLNFSYSPDISTGKVCKTIFSCGDFKVLVRGRKVTLPRKRWEKLMRVACGQDILVQSNVTEERWTIHISADSIDYGLNYRLIEPGYQSYSKMGIYERELCGYHQTTVIESAEIDGCCNCHSHCNGNPNYMSMQIRGDFGCCLILRDTSFQAYNTKTDSTIAHCGYTSWHPSADYICFSASTPSQDFFNSRKQVLEVVESSGDVMVYDVSRNQLIMTPSLCTTKYVESWPAFSADGKSIYFTRRVAGLERRDCRRVKCAMCKIDFDAQAGRLGDSCEVMIDSADIENGSVCFPKPSPDGRYVLFSRADYGIFASWHHESDLWLYDVQTGDLRPLDEVNCADSESCPAWSTNGKWFVYGSRRDDGLFTRLYIAHFDPETGRCGKPFMLPQKDPEKYYSGLFFSYNIPEFVTGPKEFNHVTARKLIYKRDSSGTSLDRIQFGVRRQGRPEEYDAVSGCSR